MSGPAAVIGGGPAGLMAAEMLADAGLPVLLAEAKPSIGRKLLMAGKSGLNLTNARDRGAFLAAYPEGARAALRPMLSVFGPDDVRKWAAALGQETFVGSSGKVFPRAMKASPLLRAWLGRLSGAGVRVETRWRWCGWDAKGRVRFATPAGDVHVEPRVTVLALGGASWPRLGSDGTWAGILEAEGVPLSPFRPANVGLRVRWSPAMARHFGAPVKGVRLMAGALSSRGEFVIGRKGLEGGGIYAVSAAVRDGAPLFLDMFPDSTPEGLAARLAGGRPGDSLSSRLRKRLGLRGARLALVNEFARPLPTDALALADALKAVAVRHDGPLPLAEAISTAGGVRWDGVDPDLMLRARPGVFVAGEMLDWEAPTGGYLLTGCLATGRWAGRAAARWAVRQPISCR